MNLDDMRKLSAYELAGMAECGNPDSTESAGAALLASVRDDVAEAIENRRTLDDAAHEIADKAPDVYTAKRWAEFVDLAAYQEDPELGEWPENLTDAAGIALYQIAERLVSALWADHDELIAEDDE